MNPDERATASLRLAGNGLDPAGTDQYLAAVRGGLIVQETRYDKGMQDNFALRAETTVGLNRARP